MKFESVEKVEERKQVVERFFGFIKQGNPRGALAFCAPDCRQHNPYTHGGMAELFEAMAEVQKQGPEYADPDLSVKNLVVEGNIAVAHTELLFSKSDPKKGGLRQAHVFRFGSDNEIVEHWDITQVILNDMPNASIAF